MSLLKCCGQTLPCREYSPIQPSNRKDFNTLLKQREESCSQDILEEHTPTLLLQSMHCCSGRVAPALHECSPSSPSAAVPVPGVLCHCLGLFFPLSVHKSNQHLYFPHTVQPVGLLLDYLALSV